MLKLKNITFQTDIKLKTTNPEWNQSFTFDLSEVIEKNFIYL